MSLLTEEDIKCWTAKRKTTSVVLDIIQIKTTISEPNRTL